MYATASRTSRIKRFPDGTAHYKLEVIEGATDAAVAITEVTDRILLDSTTGAKSITTTSSHEGQIVRIYMTARAGGSYTLALTTNAGAQTATFDAAHEMAVIERVGSVWRLICSLGTTFA